MQRARSGGLAGSMRRLVEERPTAHADVLPQTAGWRPEDAATLWPNVELAGIDPSERWVRLSTGADTLFLRAHAWAPVDRSRYLAVRLVEEPSGHVRVVDEGCLRLAEAVALLEPVRARAHGPSGRVGTPAEGGVAELVAAAICALSVVAGCWAAAAIALAFAVR